MSSMGGPVLTMRDVSVPALNLEAGNMRASIPLGEVPITFEITSMGEYTTWNVVIGTKESGA